MYSIEGLENPNIALRSFLIEIHDGFYLPENIILGYQNNAKYSDDCIIFTPLNTLDTPEIREEYIEPDPTISTDTDYRVSHLATRDFQVDFYGHHGWQESRKFATLLSSPFGWEFFNQYDIITEQFPVINNVTFQDEQNLYRPRFMVTCRFYFNYTITYQQPYIEAVEFDLNTVKGV